MTPIRTFLVEDSRVIREALVATLEEMSSLRVVGSADEEAAAVAWLAASENQCDLLIVDLFLRRGSGFGVLQAARNSGRSCSVVVLSNYATPDVRRRCLMLGADRVFDKSGEIDALIDFCAQLAERQSDTTAPVARSA